MTNCLRLWLILTFAIISSCMHGAEVNKIIDLGNKAVTEQRYTDAIGYYYQMLNLYKQGERDAAMCGAFVNAGGCCSVSNRYVEALEFYTVGIKVSEEYHNINEYSKCLNNVGIIYAMFGDFERAEHYFRKSYQSAYKQKDEYLISISVVNLLGVYCKLGDIAKAKEYYQLQTLHPLKDKHENQLNLLVSQADISSAEGNYNGAIFYLKKALDVVDVYNMPRNNLASVYSELGKAYMKLKGYDSALTYYHKVVAIAREVSALDVLTETYKSLSEAYELLNNPDSSATYKLKYVELSDSIFNQKRFNSTKDKLASYEEQMNEEHIFSLNGRIRAQSWIIAAISVLFIGVIIILLMVYHYNRKLHDTYRLLIEKNRQLTLSDKDKLQLRQELLQERSEAFVISEEKKAKILNDIAKVMSDESVIADPDFTIAKLAKYVGSNSKYINQVLTDVYHKSFKAYLIELRVREASRRLTDGEHYGQYTIAAIASSVGYNSSSTFIQAFKRVMGMTPSVYKDINKRNGQP